MTQKQRRSYGTGSLFTSHGSWYGQWRVNGSLIKRKLGPKRQPGSSEGLTRKMAEAELRRRIEVTEAPPPTPATSVGETGERLVRSLEAQGRKASTLAAYESTLPMHLIPFFGERPVTKITTEDVEAFIARRNSKGGAPKSVRNYIGTLHSILDYTGAAEPGHLRPASHRSRTPTRTSASAPRMRSRR